MDLDTVLEEAANDPRLINELLETYGQCMWRSGGAYWKLSETLNGVADRQRLLYRRLGLAWDVAFQWRGMEPTTHHLAIPKSVLLAIVALSILWGWPRAAALFLMGFTCLLRTDEFASASRRHLVFPADVLYEVDFMLVIVPFPKTRLKMAKQQTSRVAYPDVIDFLAATFAALPPDERLWPLGTSSLRRRFNLVCERIGLPTPSRKLEGQRPLELGGIRGGGATAMMLETDDPPRVQRQGRWANPKVMEIYLQELAAVSLIPSLEAETRKRVRLLAAASPSLMTRAAQLQRQAIPPVSWPTLFAAAHAA